MGRLKKKHRHRPDADDMEFQKQLPQHFTQAREAHQTTSSKSTSNGMNHFQEAPDGQARGCREAKRATRRSKHAFARQVLELTENGDETLFRQLIQKVARKEGCNPNHKGVDAGKDIDSAIGRRLRPNIVSVSRRALAVVDSGECNPVHIAARKGHFSLLAYLLELCCLIHQPRLEGVADMMAAIHLSPPSPVVSQHTPPSPATAQNTEGLTPLHLACDGGHLTAVQMFIDQGMSLGVLLDVCTVAGVRPLHLALLGSHADIVERLIACGASAEGWQLVFTPAPRLIWANPLALRIKRKQAGEAAIGRGLQRYEDVCRQTAFLSGCHRRLGKHSSLRFLFTHPCFEADLVSVIFSFVFDTVASSRFQKQAEDLKLLAAEQRKNKVLSARQAGTPDGVMSRDADRKRRKAKKRALRLVGT